MPIADALSASREQLSSIARATAYAMIGYAINTAIAVWAFWGQIAGLQLFLWAALSFALSAHVGARAASHRSSRTCEDAGFKPRSATKALALAFLLALPWSILAAWHNSVDLDTQIVLIALVVGMAASGSILLAP